MPTRPSCSSSCWPTGTPEADSLSLRIWSLVTGLGFSTTMPGWCRHYWTGSPIAAMCSSSKRKATASGRAWQPGLWLPLLEPVGGQRLWPPPAPHLEAERPHSRLLSCRRCRGPLLTGDPRYPHYATPFPGPLPLPTAADFSFSPRWSLFARSQWSPFGLTFAVLLEE